MSNPKINEPKDCSRLAPHEKPLLVLCFLLFTFQCSEADSEQKQQAAAVTSNADVQLATLDWQPYVGQDLPNKGYVYQLVEQVFAEQGLTVNIQFLPFARTY